MSMNRPFIGMGINPDGPDLPMGFGMQLAQDSQAVANYGSLSKAQQISIINYIHSSTTGEDAQRRIYNAVESLKNNDMRFLG